MFKLKYDLKDENKKPPKNRWFFYLIDKPCKISAVVVFKAWHILNNRLIVIPCLLLNILLIVVSLHFEALANSELFPLNFTRNNLYIL